MTNIIQFKKKTTESPQSILQVSTELVKELDNNQVKKLTVGQVIEILSEYDKDTYIDIVAFMEFKNGNTVCGYSNDLSLEESFYVDDEFVDDDSNTLYFQINVKAIEKD